MKKEQLKSALLDQYLLMKNKSKSEHSYYIESFQYELANIINPELQNDDSLPDDFYISFDSLSYYIKNDCLNILIDDLLKYESEV